MSVRHQLLAVEARREPIRIDTEATAVLVVDMQNDFGAAGGMFDRAGIDVGIIRKVISPIARVVAAARVAGIAIVYLKMEYQPDLLDLGPEGSPNWIKQRAFGVGQSVRAPDGREGRILIKGTWNTQIVDELAPQPADIVISKHRFSGFFETNLDAILKARGVKCLIVTGCTTSVCVESTIRDAMFRNYSCILLGDCTAETIGDGLPRSNYEASLLVVEQLLGWVSTSDAFLNALKSR
jgi:ureidoacrylate peracid hydrolase